MRFKHNTPLSSDPLCLPSDDPVKPPALGLEESVEDDPNLNIDPSQPDVLQSPFKEDRKWKINM